MAENRSDFLRAMEEARLTQRRGRPVGQAADGSPLGQQVMMRGIQYGAGMNGPAPVLLFRVNGVDDQGSTATLTLGIAEEHVDQLLTIVQKGVAAFKEQQANNGT